MKTWIIRNKDGSLEIWIDYGGGKPAKLNGCWMGEDGFLTIPSNHPIGEKITWESSPTEVRIVNLNDLDRAREKLNSALEELVETRRQLAILRTELSCGVCDNQFKIGVCGSCHDVLKSKLEQLK